MSVERYTIRCKLILRINIWLEGLDNTNLPEEFGTMLVMRALLQRDEPPWRFIKNTKTTHSICADFICKTYKLVKSPEREYMDRWLLDEKFWETDN